MADRPVYMFSGWGVRTLSAGHAAFDPLAYQQGDTVDTEVLAATGLEVAVE